MHIQRAQSPQGPKRRQAPGKAPVRGQGARQRLGAQSKPPTGSAGPAAGPSRPRPDPLDQGAARAAVTRARQGQDADLGKLKTLQEAKLDGNRLYFKAGGSIDVDGSGPSHGDPHKQWRTSLSLSGKPKYPNADRTPYFVLPKSVAEKMGVQVGDVGLIRRGDKMVPAVFADVGPKGKIGELSRYAAQKLGINADPVGGGVPSDVEYLVFPNSRMNRRLSQEDITPQALAAQVNRQLAGPKEAPQQ